MQFALVVETTGNRLRSEIQSPVHVGVKLWLSVAITSSALAADGPSDRCQSNRLSKVSSESTRLPPRLARQPTCLNTNSKGFCGKKIQTHDISTGEGASDLAGAMELCAASSSTTWRSSDSDISNRSGSYPGDQALSPEADASHVLMTSFLSNPSGG